MLIRPFRRTTKCLSSLLVFVLMYTIYVGYRSYAMQISWNATSDRQKNKDKSKLLIVILSGPRNLKQREAVRRTWLSENYENVKHLFVIGTQGVGNDQRDGLIFENETHRDLLLLPNLKDSYQVLTEKVLQAFALVYKGYNFEFVLKCDDDSFVLVERVLKELDNRQYKSSEKELYWGFFNGKAQVKRSGPWKENDWIFCDFYLPYALGGGYVLSHGLVKFIAQNANILRRYNSEDVSVGLWLAPLANIERKHDVRFDTEYQSRGCSNKYIITHKQNIDNMNILYQAYKADGILCLKEVRYRNSYLYDWHVPPSKCCSRQPGIP